MKTLCLIALTPNCYDSQQDYYNELIKLEENKPQSVERDNKIKSLKVRNDYLHQEPKLKVKGRVNSHR